MNPTWSSTRLNRRWPHKRPPERPEAHLTLFGIADLTRLRAVDRPAAEGFRKLLESMGVRL